MKINKEKLKESFLNKFTYKAGDGDRMETSPQIPQKVFDYLISCMESYASDTAAQQRNACADWVENNAVMDCPLVTDEPTS